MLPPTSFYYQWKEGSEIESWGVGGELDLLPQLQLQQVKKKSGSPQLSKLHQNRACGWPIYPLQCCFLHWESISTPVWKHPGIPPNGAGTNVETMLSVRIARFCISLSPGKFIDLLFLIAVPDTAIELMHLGGLCHWSACAEKLLVHFRLL